MKWSSSTRPRSRGGSYKKFVKRFDDDDVPSHAEFSEYQTWLNDLREGYGSIVEQIFEAYDNHILLGYQFHGIRQSMGLAPIDENYFQALLR
jgi:hypothetical protein